MHRYRITFMTGLAVGFVLGARAGRERYEQIKKLARSAADSPAAQQAAGAVQAQATELLKNARQKVTSGVQQQVPRMAQGARHAVTEHIPGLRPRDSRATTGDQPLATAGGHGNGRAGRSGS